MKKLFCIILALLILSLFAGCSDAPKSNRYSFEDTDGGVIVKAVSVRTRTLDIPESYQGKPVVAIADNAFYRSEDLRKVTIPSSVRSIGVNAFADCPKLNTVIFEKGGSCTIAESAFEGCTLLRRLDFNNSVVAVGERAFMNCKRIFSLSVGEELTEIGYGAFIGCEQMLFQAPDGSYALEYAEENHLITEFTDTDLFFYMEIIAAFLFGALLLVLLNLYSKKRKKNKKSS
jgi:hypothetical protein